MLARALCTGLTATLGALEAGRIDVAPGAGAGRGDHRPDRPAGAQGRGVVLDGLPATALDGTGPVGPWDGPTPAAFARRVRTAVAKVRTDVEEHVRRDVRERTGIRTWTHPENPALSTMTVTGPTDQVQTIATTAGRRRPRA